MPKHTKAKRAIKRAIAKSKIKTATGTARNRAVRLERGEEITKTFRPSHPINKTPSPGVKARVRNLRTVGEAVPTITGGKRDKGGPIKRASVAFNRARNRATDKNTAKKKRGR